MGQKDIRTEIGADLRGGGGGGLRRGGCHLIRHSTPLCYFEKSILATKPKNVLRTPSAPIYTNFEGERATKFSKKCKKKRLYWPLFSKVCLRHRKFR